VPRAGLSREVVVAEAAQVADEVGYDRLTLAAVAERLGVAVPSLYKHVDGIGELRRHLTVLALRELGVVLGSAVVRGADADDGLRAMAEAYRGYAHAHPGRYPATLRAVDPHDHDADEASRALLQTVFSVLAHYGLSGDDAIDATRALRSALHGFVALEAMGGFGLPRDIDRSFARLVQILDTAFRDWRPERVLR
jgi:AcrR family transcriptional regulator